MSGTMSYDDTMAWGAEQYRDVLTLLEEEGLPAAFTQTGGMCAAIEVQLETGHTLLITDADDTLSWARAEHVGWGVGLYERDNDGNLPIAFAQTDASDLDSLLKLVGDVIFQRPGTSTALWQS